MISIYESARGLIQSHLKAYRNLNILFYGLFLLGIILGGFIPNIQEMLVYGPGDSMLRGRLYFMPEGFVYLRNSPGPLQIFHNDLLVGAFLNLTLPSLFIPYLGLAVGCIRALLWGIMVSPLNTNFNKAVFPFMILLMLEGQAYVFAMLAVTIQAKGLFFPRRNGYKIPSGVIWAGLRIPF